MPLPRTPVNKGMKKGRRCQEPRPNPSAAVLLRFRSGYDRLPVRGLLLGPVLGDGGPVGSVRLYRGNLGIVAGRVVPREDELAPIGRPGRAKAGLRIGNGGCAGAVGVHGVDTVDGVTTTEREHYLRTIGRPIRLCVEAAFLKRLV